MIIRARRNHYWEEFKIYYSTYSIYSSSVVFLMCLLGTHRLDVTENDGIKILEFVIYFVYI